MASFEAELRIARLREAVLAGGPAARAEARKALRRADTPLPTRAKAGLALIAPIMLIASMTEMADLHLDPDERLPDADIQSYWPRPNRCSACAFPESTHSSSRVANRINAR